MRAGNLIHRIKFYPKVTARDQYNASVDSYPIATISTRGEIRYSGGSKTISNEEIFFSKTMELTIRYRTDIVETMRVQIDGKKDLYYINGIPEIIGKNEAIRLPLEKISDGLSEVIINPPSMLVAAMVTNYIALTWLNNANDDAVLIERSLDCATWVQIKRTLREVEAYSDTAIEENTRYFYRIRHIVYSDFSAYSNISDDETGSFLFAGSPTNLILTANIDNPEITLDWTIGSINYDGHSIERSLDGITFAVIDTVAAGIDTYVDIFTETPEEETLYYYRVRAYQGDLFSDYTDIESIILGIFWIPTTLVVENANSNKVVMTSDVANTNLSYTDFSIAGFTINSLSRDVTNKILTLTLSTNVLYGNILNVILNSNSYSVTNNVLWNPANLPGNNTVAWYDSQLLSTITKDGSNFVSRWNDKLSSGRDLIQATGTNQPLWSANGILFDGIDNVMKTAPFTFIRPAMIYFVGKQITYSSPDHLFDGNSQYAFTVYQNAGSPSISLYCGGADVANTGMALNTNVILRALSNGASSFLRINNGTQSNGNAGANNPSGFTLAASGVGTTRFANIEVKEIILRNVADDAPTQTLIYNYLALKYGFATI